MAKSKNVRKDNIPEVANVFDPKRFASDLYTYCNYEKLLEECKKTGSRIGESREFYGQRILDAIETFFDGISKEDIEIGVMMFING